MDHHDRFRRAASEAGIPQDEVSTFARFLRFAIWAVERRDNGVLVGHPKGIPPGQTADVPVGRAGGRPRLPVGVQWPSGPGGPLPFVASFDCAALPEAGGFALPPDGSLLVFLHHEWAYQTFDRVDEQEHARIVYVPAGTDTATADEPDHEEHMFSTMRGFVGPERVLFAVVHAERPDWLDNDEDGEGEGGLSDFQRELIRDLPHRRELCALAERLWPDGTYAEFKFGGYTRVIGEMQTEHLYTGPELTLAEENLEARQEAADLVIAPGQEDFRLEEELHRVMAEWVPLVQFDPGDDVYIGRFLIRVDDLAARRFERAMSCTAFTE
ncbi:DUF1963 domain-containing protein [Dactylosporangium sp. McL0621]|uniref:DUF1963 domain-containing protein n=1 Tax=Dactylosporangium sp. McL0621 TaxID=3415678 RepID=UPI003CECEF27